MADTPKPGSIGTISFHAGSGRINFTGVDFKEVNEAKALKTSAGAKLGEKVKSFFSEETLKYDAIEEFLAHEVEEGDRALVTARLKQVMQGNISVVLASGRLGGAEAKAAYKVEQFLKLNASDEFKTFVNASIAHINASAKMLVKQIEIIDHIDPSTIAGAEGKLDEVKKALDNYRNAALLNIKRSDISYAGKPRYYTVKSDKPGDPAGVIDFHGAHHPEIKAAEAEASRTQMALKAANAHEGYQKEVAALGEGKSEAFALAEKAAKFDHEALADAKLDKALAGKIRGALEKHLPKEFNAAKDAHEKLAKAHADVRAIRSKMLETMTAPEGANAEDFKKALDALKGEIARAESAAKNMALVTSEVAGGASKSGFLGKIFPKVNELGVRGTLVEHMGGEGWAASKAKTSFRYAGVAAGGILVGRGLLKGNKENENGEVVGRGIGVRALETVGGITLAAVSTLAGR